MVTPAGDFVESERPPVALRAAHLDSLQQGQSLWLEQRVRTGRSWSLPDCVYVVVEDCEIVEFHASPHLDPIDAFTRALEACGARSMVCTSFDAPAISVASARATTTDEVGILFHTYRATQPVWPDGFTIRDGLVADVDIVAGLDDGFFDGPDEIAGFQQRGGLVIGEFGGDLVGCALSTVVIDGRPGIDVGMWVSPAWRGRGFGPVLVGAAAARAEASGGIPIAGCDVANIASIRSLMRVGFVADHRLIRFVFDGD